MLLHLRFILPVTAIKLIKKTASSKIGKIDPTQFSMF